MKINEVYNGSEGEKGCVATIGFFDGVHLGHRYLINKVIEVARHQQQSATVVTFDRHPREVLSTGWHVQLLSTLEEKKSLLSASGIDRLVVLPFDGETAALSAHDFMANVLRDRLNVRTLVTGYDNRFGHRTAGMSEGFADYVAYGHELGINVICGDAYDAGAVRVSSSKVRRMLLDGDVEQAANCLGRPYALSGTVVSGEHVGTLLGFPTANLQPSDASKLIPATGAYAVSLSMDDGLWRHGMMNIGRRPTFNGDHLTLEVHIFHFEGDLYGRRLTVKFISRLRPEMKFGSADMLARQLAADACQAEHLLNMNEQKR